MAELALGRSMRTRVHIAAVTAALVIITSLTPTSAMAAAPGEQGLVAEMLDQLRVSAPSTAAYISGRFREGLDLDGDGCDTKQEILFQKSEVPATVEGDCTVISGQWTSYYDNVIHVDPAATELEHLVPLKEAWISGAWSWSDAQRDAFANDTDDSRTLNIVTPGISAVKADKDPAGWVPQLPFENTRCVYASQWIVVKLRWNLAIDPAEKTALQKALAQCFQPTAVVPVFPADRPGTPTPDTQYYTTKYDSTIWAVTPTSVAALTFAQWKAAGTPTPRPAPTEFVKYAWSSTVSAVTMFGADKSRWVWKHVSAAEWKRAGNPKPRIAGWIEGSTYYQWADSPQIFVQDVGGKKHALTGKEWAASGYQPFEKRTNQGFVKLSWHSSIAFLTDYANGTGTPVTAASWTAEGNPSPVVRKRFPNDKVWKNFGTSAIHYSGPTVSKTLTYSEWLAMGSPRPEVRGAPTAPPKPTRDKNCGDYPSQAAAQADFNRYYSWYGDIFRLDGDGDGIACESYFG